MSLPETRGLSSSEAAERLIRFGPNALGRSQRLPWLLPFLRQFRSPIFVLLVAAAVLSGYLGDVSDSFTILIILLVSSVLGFTQEYRAGQAVQELLKLVQTQVQAIRDGETQRVPITSIVPGDVVRLEAGSAIPGDGNVLESNNLLVDEAVLTGESAPIEKKVDEPLSAGTHVLSGTGLMLIQRTGASSQLGALAGRLQHARPEPEFHLGIRRYGILLVEFTLALSMAVFAINVLLHKPVVESLLFSLAISVGMTPQLLPAIMSITLATGAKQLAKSKIVVKRLESIEDLGSMDVFCSDKTGTLTQGTMSLAKAVDVNGGNCPEALHYGGLNSALQQGYSNPIDELLAAVAPDTSEYTVVSEIPYDFFRRRLSLLLQNASGTTLVTKGSVETTLACCSRIRSNGGEVPSEEGSGLVLERFRQLSEEGFRVIAVAIKENASTADEQDMDFLGLLALEDPLRPDTLEAADQLKQHGIGLKLLTGDNRHIAAHVGRAVGLRTETILTGNEVRKLDRKSLAARVADTDIFAEIDPIQKERLILAQRDLGRVVGYMGDGINDSAALHAADVGISVSNAADVTKDAADIVMLERGLAVLAEGIEQGRSIFANTLKYVSVTTSANFGNMFSMAAASLFLPFLPLLPKQILLNNFLTDIPALSIAGDRVDSEQVVQPHRWHISQVRRTMLIFGLQSSVFDMLSFWVLLRLLRGTPEQFRTGWFIESALSELLILLVLRTRRPFYKSKPGPALLVASVLVAMLVLLLPLAGRVLSFSPLPPHFLAAILLILAVYTATAEFLKRLLKTRG